jgi:glycosyltransferase involved in cell wall biosynthesis
LPGQSIGSCRADDGRDEIDRLSIVVPVYNERATITAVVDRLQTMDLPMPREIIVVNDGSRDGTRAVLDELAVRYPDLVILQSDVNRGKGHAIRQGFSRATGTIVAIQDADLELDPAQLARLVAPIAAGTTSVVYGSRFLDGRNDVPWLVRHANRTLTTMTNVLFGSKLTDMETCYKIMRADIARSLPLRMDRFEIEPEITAQLLLHRHAIVELPVTFSPRSRAQGKKIGWRDGISAIRTLIRLRLRG